MELSVQTKPQVGLAPASKLVKRSRVYKGSIDSLSMGQGIIEDGGRFQPFGYREIPFPDGSLPVRAKGRSAS